MTTGPEPTPEPGQLGVQVRERLWAAANVVAPTTVLTTLLFYFGYVATTARFRYFGVYLDMVDLSLQEMLLKGVEVVYPPLILLAIVSLLVIAGHTVVRWLLSSPERDAVTGWTGLLVAVAGLLAFARGVVGLLVPHVARTEAIATTPASLGCGASALAYGIWLLRTVAIRWDRRREADGGSDDETNGTGDGAGGSPARLPDPGRLAAWLESRTMRQLSRHALAWIAVVVVAGAFWAANSFAAAYGRGRALDDADALARRPEVVLYARQPIRDLPAGVEQTKLPAAGKDPYRFRYQGLRLLVESQSRLFLVPAQWVPGSSRTLVVPYDDSVRLDLLAAAAPGRDQTASNAGAITAKARSVSSVASSAPSLSLHRCSTASKALSAIPAASRG